MKIINNLLEISHENDNIPIEIKSLKLEFSANKYSSKKNSIYHIIFNDKHLSKRDRYNIKYKCVSCDSIHIVGTTQFLRKINKCSYRCNLCVNQDANKRLQHSQYFLSLPDNQPKNVDNKTLSLVEMKKESEKLFDEYDDDFKTSYLAYHITNDDYKRISKNIISLQNGKYKIQDLEFWPIFKTNNQMLFSSVFYDKINNVIIKANQPIMKCENCNEEWRAKALDKYKNCHRVLCPSCICCNKTLKIRTTKNCINELVLYKSQQELKFINWCNNNSIKVKNGPTIPYIFENKEGKYRVDFMINDLLIEIKDMQNGKNKAKIDAVMELIKEGKYKDYYLITPDIWIYTLKKIKQNLNKI